MKCSSRHQNLLLSLLIISECAAALAPQGARAQDGPGRGGQIFKATCSPCHTIGGGRKVGPDLQGVTKRRPTPWLFSFISNPDKMFSQNDATALKLLKEYTIKMPNTGLSPDDVNAVISYLETQSGGAPEQQAALSPKSSPTVPSPLSGDSARGEEYFTGRVSFQSGGPPCMTCHGVPGIKYLGGGNLGPDLTQVYASLGSGIVSVLVNVPFPTMKPIFDAHPLTMQEAQDLAAFLQRIGSEQPENYTGLVVTVSLITFAVLMVIIHAIWHRRLTGVRKGLVERANREDDRR